MEGTSSLRVAQGDCVGKKLTFLTNSLTTSLLTTSSASCQSPSASYVRRHSVTSAYSFDFSISLPFPAFPPSLPTNAFNVVAKR